MGDLDPRNAGRALPGVHRGPDVPAAHVRQQHRAEEIRSARPSSAPILTFTGLYWLGGLKPGDSAVIAFMAATIFGIGKTFFMPTMLGLASEQLPRGGALLMSHHGRRRHARDGGRAAHHGRAHRPARRRRGAADDGVPARRAGRDFVGLWLYYGRAAGTRRSAFPAARATERHVDVSSRLNPVRHWRSPSVCRGARTAHGRAPSIRSDCPDGFVYASRGRDRATRPSHREFTVRNRLNAE